MCGVSHKLPPALASVGFPDGLQVRQKTFAIPIRPDFVQNQNSRYSSVNNRSEGL